MQIQTTTGGGTASVTNGSNLVYAQAGIDWSQVVRGCWFTVAGSGVTYTIAAAPVLTAGVYHIQLSANYAGPTNVVASYVIHKDFFDNGAPILAIGDTELYTLFNRWLQTQSGISSGISGAGLITKQIPITGALIGAREIQVVFDVALDDKPSFVAHPIFVKGSAAEDNVLVTSVDSVTKFGFSVNLSDAAISGQVLHCGWSKSAGIGPTPPPPTTTASQFVTESGTRLTTESGSIFTPE